MDKTFTLDDIRTYLRGRQFVLVGDQIHLEHWNVALEDAAICLEDPRYGIEAVVTRSKDKK